jgi:hypothetical protein
MATHLGCCGPEDLSLYPDLYVHPPTSRHLLTNQDMSISVRVSTKHWDQVMDEAAA